MFLNSLGQPYIFNENSKNLLLDYEKLQNNDPLLLCSSAVRTFDMPKSWRGCVYGMREPVTRQLCVFKQLELQPIGSCVLQPFKPLAIPLESSNLAELTMIPAGKNNDDEQIVIFILKDKHVRALITNELGCTLDWLPVAGTLFHDCLQAGFDIMYIDDSLYACQTKSPEEVGQLEQHHHLYALVQLIQPKQLVGLARTELPEQLLNLCAKEDLLADVDPTYFNVVHK